MGGKAPKIPAVKPIAYTPPPLPEVKPPIAAPVPVDAKNALTARRNQLLAASESGQASGRSSTILSDRLGG